MLIISTFCESMRLFAASDAIFAANGGRSTVYQILDDCLQILDVQIPFEIIEAYSSSDPESGVPIAVVFAADDTFVVNYIDCTCIPLRWGGQTVILDELTRLTAKDGELLRYSFTGSSKLIGIVPVDVVVLCATPHEALLVSHETGSAFIATRRAVTVVRASYARDASCAAFFDEGSFVCGVGDDVILVCEDSVRSVTVGALTLRVFVGDFDCCERACVCLGNDRCLRIVRFNARVVSVVAEDVDDFVVVHNPFTRVVFTRGDSIEVLDLRENAAVEIAAAADALDSRIVAGLASLANSRKRLAMRRALVKGDNAVQLPHLVTLFGECPNETVAEEVEEKRVKYWIENLHGMEFEIHGDAEFPPVCDVVIASKVCSFAGACVNTYVSETVMNVCIAMDVERMPKCEAFAVFLRSDTNVSFVGFIELSVASVAASNVKRLDEEYFISFPKHFAMQRLPVGCEPVDGGIVARVSGNNIDDFERKIVGLAFTLPEAVRFERRVNTHIQVQLAKEAARCVRGFPQALSNMEGSADGLPKQLLVDVAVSISDILAATLS